MLLFHTSTVADPGLLAPLASEGIRVSALPAAGRDALTGALTTDDVGAPAAVIVDYPVETAEDVDTVRAFCAHVRDNAGHWYYAPRPNEYVWVAKPAMVGISPIPVDLFPAPEDMPVPAEAAPAVQGTARNIRDLGMAFIARLPSSIRPVAESTGRRIWRALYAVGGSPGSDVAPASAGPPASPSTAAVEAFPPASPSERGAAEPADAAPSAVSDPELLRQAQGGVPTIIVPSALSHGWPAEWRSWEGTETSRRRDLLDRVGTFFPRPLGIHVVVLNKCNLACVMCPFHSPVYKPGHKSDFFGDYNAMTSETFERIAEYAGKHAIGLQFGQVEEPMMHKKLPEMFRLAKAKGVPHIHMTTNGTLLTPDKADELLDSGLTSLMVSLDASDPETYREIRGSDLEAVEENLRYFLPRAKARGIKTWVSFILQDRALEERQAFFEKWRAIGVDNVTFYVLGTHDTETGELVDHKFMYDRETKRYPCASPWVQSVVFPSGEVSLCCRTMGLVGWTGIVSVGTLAERTFEEIWTGDDYRRVREELLRNEFEKFSICEKCSIWSATTSMVEKASTYERVYNETMETFIFTN